LLTSSTAYKCILRRDMASSALGGKISNGHTINTSYNSIEAKITLLLRISQEIDLALCTDGAINSHITRCTIIDDTVT
jgi:hypothetical protein